MYFVESEYLLREGVAGQLAIEAIDAFLYARTLDSLFTEELVTVSTGQHKSAVRVALTAYCDRGALECMRMIRCKDEGCHTLTPADRVERARIDGDEELCDGVCGEDLAAQSAPEVVHAYRLVALPVL
jgi:hypothetical protein